MASCRSCPEQKQIKDWLFQTKKKQSSSRRPYDCWKIYVPKLLASQTVAISRLLVRVAQTWWDQEWKTQKQLLLSYSLISGYTPILHLWLIREKGHARIDCFCADRKTGCLVKLHLLVCHRPGSSITFMRQSHRLRFLKNAHSCTENTFVQPTISYHDNHCSTKHFMKISVSHLSSLAVAFIFFKR